MRGQKPIFTSLRHAAPGSLRSSNDRVESINLKALKQRCLLDFGPMVECRKRRKTHGRDWVFFRSGNYLGEDKIEEVQGGSLSLADMLTSSARESACIFSITRARCTFTVFSTIPSSEAICLFNNPRTTSLKTSCSRGESEANLCSSSQHFCASTDC